MLSSLNFPDAKLCDDIIVGFKLTGWMRDSGSFIQVPRPPSLSTDGLIRLNKGLVGAVLKRVEQQQIDDLVTEAWSETKKELERSWIWEGDATELAGKVIVHRFGLAQKNKVRVIDNFKQCGLNETCDLPEKCVLRGVDYIAATLIHGMTLMGRGKKLQLVGKTYDLFSAYKQYPLHSDDRQLVRIAVKDTDTDRCRVYGLMRCPLEPPGHWPDFCVSLQPFSASCLKACASGLAPFSTTFQLCRQKLAAASRTSMLRCCST